MNPLEQLKDIHAAPDPGIWPLAPGWWILIVLVLLAITGVVYAVRRYQKFRRQQLVLGEFEAAFARYQKRSDVVVLTTELHQLVRRLMLASGEQRQMGLSGEAFLEYLDRGCDGQPFMQGAGRWLVDAPYRQVDSINESFDGQSLYSAVFQWARSKVQAV